MDLTDDRRIAELVDRQAITDVLHRYARGWDRADVALLRDCFWPDSHHRHSAFDGRSHDFIDSAMARLTTVLGMQHSISNVMIDLDGDRAFSECHFDSFHRRPGVDGGPEHDYLVRGRYIDRHERRGGVWKIVARRGLNDFQRLVPHDDVMFASAAPGSVGVWSTDDELYSLYRDFVDRPAE